MLLSGWQLSGESGKDILTLSTEHRQVIAGINLPLSTCHCLTGYTAEIKPNSVAERQMKTTFLDFRSLDGKVQKDLHHMVAGGSALLAISVTRFPFYLKVYFLRTGIGMGLWQKPNKTR